MLHYGRKKWRWSRGVHSAGHPKNRDYILLTGTEANRQRKLVLWLVTSTDSAGLDLLQGDADHVLRTQPGEKGGGMKQTCQWHCFSTLNHNLGYCYNDETRHQVGMDPKS